jgi:predicted ester cyclase
LDEERTIVEKIMSEEDKALVRKFFKLLELELRIPEELLAPGFIYHVAGSPPKDLEATRQRATEFIAAFSDVKRFEEDMIAEGDKVAFRSTLEATHTGEFMGVAGSGKRISVVEMGIMRIADGKIAEMWGLLDTMGLMRQIGAMPSPGQPRSA